MRDGNTQVLEHLICELSSLGRIVSNHPALTYMGGQMCRHELVFANLVAEGESNPQHQDVLYQQTKRRKSQPMMMK